MKTVLLAMAVFAGVAPPGSARLRRLGVLEAGAIGGAWVLDTARHRLYVTSTEGTGRLSGTRGPRILEFDTVSLKRLRAVQATTGSTPFLATDARQARLCLTCTAPPRLESMDLRTGRIAWSRPLERPPGPISVSSTAPRIFVPYAERVLVLNARTGVQTARFAAGETLATDTIVEDGWLNRAFAVTRRNALMVFDLERSTTRRVARLWEPRFTALAPTPRLGIDPGRHRLYLLQPWPHNRLLVYSSRTLRRLCAVPLPEGAQAIAVDNASGRVFITALDPPRILVIDGAGGRVLETYQADVVPEPWEARFDSKTGRLFVKSYGLNRIGIYQYRR